MKPFLVLVFSAVFLLTFYDVNAATTNKRPVRPVSTQKIDDLTSKVCISETSKRPENSLIFFYKEKHEVNLILIAHFTRLRFHEKFTMHINWFSELLCQNNSIFWFNWNSFSLKTVWCWKSIHGKVVTVYQKRLSMNIDESFVSH